MYHVWILLHGNEQVICVEVWSTYCVSRSANARHVDCAAPRMELIPTGMGQYPTFGVEVRVKGRVRDGFWTEAEAEGEASDSERVVKTLSLSTTLGNSYTLIQMSVYEND